MSTHLYRAFGAWIESAIAFPWLAGTEQPAGYAPADLAIVENKATPHALRAQDAGAPLYRSGWLMPTGEPFMIAYRLNDCDLLQFHEGFSFAIRDDSIEVELTDPSQHHQAQMQLLGPVMAYWLERGGALALHASAIVMDGVALAFTANSRGGKSTLAASFVEAGAAMLTDDILPCRLDGATVAGSPGFPSMRMWPAEAERFVGHYRDLDLVHPAIDKRRTDVGEGAFGRYHDAIAPLAGIYQPMRRDPENGPPRIEITPLSRAEALVELSRMSFMGRLARTAFHPDDRLELVAQIARRAPVKRLSYPSGYEHLPAVREAVLNDARGALANSSIGLGVAA